MLLGVGVVMRDAVGCCGIMRYYAEQIEQQQQMGGGGLLRPEQWFTQNIKQNTDLCFMGWKNGERRHRNEKGNQHIIISTY